MTSCFFRQRSHVVMTITSPSESLLNDLRSVEVGPYFILIVVADIHAYDLLEAYFLLNCLPWLVKNLQLFSPIKMHAFQFLNLSLFPKLANLVLSPALST